MSKAVYNLFSRRTKHFYSTLQSYITFHVQNCLITGSFLTAKVTLILKNKFPFPTNSGMLNSEHSKNNKLDDKMNNSSLKEQEKSKKRLHKSKCI